MRSVGSAEAESSDVCASAGSCIHESGQQRSQCELTAGYEQYYLYELTVPLVQSWPQLVHAQIQSAAVAAATAAAADDAAAAAAAAAVAAAAAAAAAAKTDPTGMDSRFESLV